MVTSLLFIVAGLTLIAAASLGILSVPDETLAWLDNIPIKALLIVAASAVITRLILTFWRLLFRPAFTKTLLTAFSLFIAIATSIAFGPIMISEMSVVENKIMLKFSDLDFPVALTVTAVCAIAFACLLLYYIVRQYEIAQGREM